MNVAPEWNTIAALARKRALRGADLWHLSAAKTLQAELPELKVLTFDAHLARAARDEGLA